MGPCVRAKFRVLGITQKYDGLFIAELRPVQQKGQNSEENKMFWEYSPNGECSLTYYGKHSLEVGAYYYIDMERIEHPQEGAELWSLNSVGRDEGGGAQVYLSWYKSYDYQKGKPEGMLSGNLKIGMEKKAQGAITAMSEPGTKWKVDFRFAEGSDGER